MYNWADNLMRDKFLKAEEKIHKFVLPFASLVFHMWSEESMMCQHPGVKLLLQVIACV